MRATYAAHLLLASVACALPVPEVNGGVDLGSSRKLSVMLDKRIWLIAEIAKGNQQRDTVTGGHEIDFNHKINERPHRVGVASSAGDGQSNPIKSEVLSWLGVMRFK
ncbi:hypothetical protein SCUP234_01324 [Seiridium cupressi]